MQILGRFGARHHGRPDPVEVPPHILDQFSRAERRPPNAGGADRLATPTIHAGVQVHERLPAEAIDLTDSQSIQGFFIFVQHFVDIGVRKLARRAEIAEKDIARAVEDMGEFSVDEIGDECEGRNGVKPPEDPVKTEESLRIETAEREGHGVADG